MRLSRSLCAVVAEVIARTGSHATLDGLFTNSGAPGEPPAMPHPSKWKEWLFRAGQDEKTDSLAVLGNVIEEFMDLAPKAGTREHLEWREQRDKIAQALEENGLRYFRFGRVLPQGTNPQDDAPVTAATRAGPVKPQSVDELLEVLVKGLRRAMHPLTHRRKGTQPLTFASEYDVQDLLHALLRPWVADIRPEEFTPSYAGSSTRMDFLLPAYRLVIETKVVRDRAHGKRVGDELVVDIDHYSKHPDCGTLWCVVYDPDHLVQNAEGLKRDLEGKRTYNGVSFVVRVFVLSA
jgi:hypothetical protein